MFEHLDDPAPAPFDDTMRAAIQQRGASLQARHARRVRLTAGVAAAAVIAAGLTGWKLSSRGDRLAVRTATSPPCQTGGGYTTVAPVVVYEHVTAHAGWLPAGWRLTSGDESDPRPGPLVYSDRAAGADPPRLELTVRAGIDIVRPPDHYTPFPGTQTTTVNGLPATITRSLDPKVNQSNITWDVGPAEQLNVTGYQLSLDIVEHFATAVTTNLGPPTTITPDADLGTVIPRRQVLTQFEESNGKGIEAPTAKLMTWAELETARRAATGSQATGIPGQTPIWVVYGIGTVAGFGTPAAASAGRAGPGWAYDIFDARLATPMGTGHGPGDVPAYFLTLPDHDKSACTPSSTATRRASPR